MTFNPWRTICFEGRWPNPIISAILALVLSILLFPFGVLAVAALGSMALSKEPLLPPALGGKMENVKKSNAQLLKTLWICCLGFLAFSVLCNVLDEYNLQRLADRARNLAAYSLIPNQLSGNIDPKTAIIFNNNYAVLRSMFISLFCSSLFAVQMKKLEITAGLAAGIYLLEKKIKYSYGWGLFAVLLCLTTPAIFFVFADRHAADAGLIPRIYLLSESIIFSTIIGYSEIVGGMCLWVTAIMAAYLRDKAK